MGLVRKDKNYNVSHLVNPTIPLLRHFHGPIVVVMKGCHCKWLARQSLNG